MGKENETIDLEGPFSARDDWWMNSCLRKLSRPDWNIYAIGYKNAADYLVEQVVKTRSGLDFLVFPIIYLYRHYFELRMKLLYRDLCRLLSEHDDPPCTHKLGRLWGMVKKRLIKVFPDENQEQYENIGELIGKFENVDPASTAFRYPVDREEKMSLEGL